MERASDQPARGGHVFAVTDEAAYLEADADEKPAVAPKPPDPAKLMCWFCRKPSWQVRTLFGAEYPVRDAHDFSMETPIFICDECVARFAASPPG